MKGKDRQVVKSSIDVIISAVPGLNIAWGLSKALYGAGLELRKQRALEWVERVRDNPSIFTKEILENEQFQDGFVFILENYIRERSEEKRKVLQSIFFGFTSSKNKETFALEKFTHTLNVISEEDISILKDVDVAKDQESDRNYQIYGNTIKNIDNILNLINLGILSQDYSSRLGPTLAPFVRVTNFGKVFIKYIKK